MKIFSSKAVVNIEFIVSITIFLIVVSFVIISTLEMLPTFHREVLSDDTKTKLYQFSQQLLDEGYPKNWETNVAGTERFGLSSQDRYVLDPNKVSAMYAFCNTGDGYRKIRDSFGDYDIKLIVEKLNGTVILECKPTVQQISSEFYLDRFAVLNGDVVRIRISVIG